MTAEKPTSVPASVAIIMDGNGRWAKSRGRPRTAGHKEGLAAAKRIVRRAAERGVKTLTLYVFSTENWRRAEDEVGFLFSLVHQYLVSEFDFCVELGVRVRHIGDLSKTPKFVQDDFAEIERKTANFDKMTTVLAVNYGGRDEMLRAIKKIAAENREIDEKTLSAALDFPEIEPLDLIIRTGGEKRMSNFLLWQSAYAELFFCDTLWPDFLPDDFDAAISEFSHRARRFGAAK